jgi:TolB-like protein/class 3 adenylate cyclase/Tfp pilus assembly protein PilF
MTQSRQLAAIMFTDIVGYTALMGHDELKAFQILKKNRELQKPIIEQNNGRWIKELGDGVMASFSTVSDAIKAAVNILEGCNAAKEFQLRIGIHLGEVVFENDDVFGDGVNIAARIQAIANPGSIYVSEPVHNNISNKQGIASVFVKQETLKNVKEPVRIYEVLTKNSPATSSPAETGPPAAKPAPEKSIAVLPFVNMSNDTEQEYFSDGLTEEIIINLSRLKEMRTVSRTTSMQYKGTKKDIQTIGKEINVRYIMEGSVRKSQDNLRITAQLIDVENDTNLWAETYKGKLEDVFDIQEQVSREIVDALRIRLTPAEDVNLTKRPTENPEAFDFYLRARNFLYRRTKNSLLFATQLFQKAIELEPKYAQAYAGLGETYATFYQQFDRKEAWLEKAIESSLTALMYDSASSDAYSALGLAYFNKGKTEEALTATQKAIELDPNDFIGYWILGRIFYTTDRNREAVNQFKKVIELYPDFYAAYYDLLIVYEKLGEKEKYSELMENAFEVFPRYLSKYPDDARAHMYHAVTLTLNGKDQQARDEAAKALELSPDDPVMMFNAACFYARLGEKELALKMVINAVSIGFEQYEWLRRDPDLDSIRNEPEFVEILKGK